MNPAARRGIQNTSTEEVFLTLMTITYPNGTVSRIVANLEAVDSRGATYVAWPFAITLPNQLDSSNSAATVTFDNVDPALWQALRGLVDTPTVKIEVIMASDPNTVMVVVDFLKLRGATVTDRTITAELYVDSIWQSGYPAHDYSPPEYPGLFPNA